ncbi:DUF2085 domain-containing protein [Treponema sp. R6D11]
MEKIKVWLFFIKLGRKCGCHQKTDRSFFINGFQLPICSRCTGILIGQIIGIILFLLKIKLSLIICVIFLLIMFLDWFMQYKGKLESTNIRRLITGNLAGIAQTTILLDLLFELIKFIKVNVKY